MTFSKEEKRIIRHILEMDRLSGPNCLANIWEKNLPGVRVNFEIKGGLGVEGKVFVSKAITEKRDLASFDKYLTSIILLLIDLFDRLEKEKLIIPFNPDHKLRALGDNQFESDGDPLSVDVELRKKLAALTRKEFRVSQSLHDLADNDYMSEEALRFQETMKKERRTLRWTQFTLLAAIAAQIPAWIQVFSNKTEKVELTPASKVQVVSNETVQVELIPESQIQIVSNQTLQVELTSPSQIQIVSNQTLQVELTPASQVQVSSAEEEPFMPIEVPDGEQANVDEVSAIAESGDREIMLENDLPK